MSLSCPPELVAQMTQTVVWEKWLGFDGHAEPSYAAAKPLKCRVEQHGLMAGGQVAHRLADGTVVEPLWDLYFPGDNIDAQGFSIYDRFTVNVPAGDKTQKLQPTRINTYFGPNYDSRNPWVIEVQL